MVGPRIGTVDSGSQGRRSGRVGVLRLSGPALTTLILAAAVIVVGLLVVPVGSTPIAGDPLAAERIDVTSPAVPIDVVGSFPGSADGDRAVAAVLADLQDFWTGELSTGDGFVPPTGGYISMDSAPPEGSGLRSSALCITDPAQIAGNAYYCPQGDGIVFDSSALVPVLLNHYGSAGLAASFAHEFGHAIQAQIGPTAADRVQDPDRYPSILIEAQADCDAGAFLGWASTGSGSRVQLPPSSLIRAVAPLLDFRDPATISPLDPTAHGLGLDRLSFLLIGLRDGAAACSEMATADLPLTLGREGVTTSPPSTLPRFARTADAVDAATASIAAFAADQQWAIPAGQPSAPDPADLTLAEPLGQFAAAAAVALATGREVTGTDVGAACFTGAWAASVFGRAGVDELGSWPTDADEALDLIRARPGAQFDELAGYADGFHQGKAAC